GGAQGGRTLGLPIQGNPQGMRRWPADDGGLRSDHGCSERGGVLYEPFQREQRFGVAVDPHAAVQVEEAPADQVAVVAYVVGWVHALLVASGGVDSYEGVELVAPQGDVPSPVHVAPLFGALLYVAGGCAVPPQVDAAGYHVEP